MSTELLKTYITEVLADLDQGDDLNQNIVRKDPEGSGKLIIRKLVTYTKPSSRFAPGDDVDAELNRDGTVKVDDLENWKPEFSKTIRRPRRLRKNSRRLA
jgi:hypothetical protein